MLPRFGLLRNPNGERLAQKGRSPWRNKNPTTAVGYGIFIATRLGPVVLPVARSAAPRRAG